MYYTHPGCQTSIFGENRAYCIRDFTVIVTFLLSCIVSKLWPIKLVKFSLSIEECLTLMPPLGWSPVNIRINFTSAETRRIVLPDAENRTIVSSFVWTQYRDWRTDRQNLSGCYSTLHCDQCGGTVKTTIMIRDVFRIST